MLGEQLIGALRNDAGHCDRKSEGAAFQDAVKETKERIAAAFTKGHPIPARRKA